MKWTRYVLLVLILFTLSACQLFEDSKELQEKKQELALKKLQVEQERELAQIQIQKELALIDKEKELALEKMHNELKAKELDANSEKELELIKQKLALQQSNNDLNFQKYLFMFLGLMVVVAAFFIFYYYKRKREDELRAYNDNLKKYFYMKENESRMKIAEKILDTIAEGDLSAENEQKLINAFAKEATGEADHIAHIDDDAQIVEAIEHKKEEE